MECKPKAPGTLAPTEKKKNESCGMRLKQIHKHEFKMKSICSN
jgi:hypothetical protein